MLHIGQRKQGKTYALMSLMADNPDLFTSFPVVSSSELKVFKQKRDQGIRLRDSSWWWPLLTPAEKEQVQAAHVSIPLTELLDRRNDVGSHRAAPEAAEASSPPLPIRHPPLS